MYMYNYKIFFLTVKEYMHVDAIWLHAEFRVEGGGGGGGGGGAILGFNGRDKFIFT